MFSNSILLLGTPLLTLETNEPIVGANIMLLNTNIGTSTDIDGNYLLLNVPPLK